MNREKTSNTKEIQFIKSWDISVIYTLFDFGYIIKTIGKNWCLVLPQGYFWNTDYRLQWTKMGILSHHGLDEWSSPETEEAIAEVESNGWVALTLV